MSSIIVLDSSDEDENPPKKANTKSSSNARNFSNVTNTTAPRNQNAKQRTIPSGITITPRLSPTATTANSNSLQSTNSSLAGSYQTLNNIINKERQTPTPPKAQVPGNSSHRKRKTPTPPQAMPPRLTARNFGNMPNSSPAKAATTLAPLPPIMPMITGVHSMAAAGATPPLQLMATPPHGLGSFMGLNEQLMINPHLIPSILPPNTTITAHQNPNQNNINNNFKIHLPFNKPNATTPSPAASPASSAPKTPSPQLTTTSPQPSRLDKHAKRVKPTTLLRSSDDSWQKHKHMSQTDKQSHRIPVSLNNDVVIEMLPPATESPKSISASSSRLHTPMSSPTTPKSQKSPDVIMVATSTESTPITRKESGTVLDLTHSPDKAVAPNCSEIVDLVNTPDKPPATTKHINGGVKNIKPEKKPPPKPPLEPEYEELIKACREADPSKDMEKLIKSKLIKYYYEVHSDYVKSKSFRKNIRKVVDSIRAKPDLVYYNLKTIVEELKVRRNVIPTDESAPAPAPATTNESGKTMESTAQSPASVETVTKTETNVSATATTTSSAAEISATATTSTGNKRIDEQIRKLNKALYVLTKRIEVLEQSDVDWDDEDSSYLQVERFKKRACQIYEKICDLTGESKNAHRLVKKPIKFNETRIPQFNKTLQAFINRTKEFPDYFDVLRMLEHCNRTYSLGLVNFEIKNIAEDAFIKVGKLLQSRRKADLYEMVTHFAGDGKDPAKSDPTLAAKLNENLKNHKKISDILEKFARKQDMPDEEEEEKSEAPEETSQEANTEIKEEIVKKESAITAITAHSDDAKEDAKRVDLLKADCVGEIKKETLSLLIKEEVKMNVVGKEDDDEDDDDDDDEEEEEEDDEENLDEQVETLANGDISDNESDNETVPSNDNTTTNSNILATTAELKTGRLSSPASSDANEIVATPVNDVSNECLEIQPDAVQVHSSPQNTINNCRDHDDIPAVKNNSETESLRIINNNNLDVATNTNTTKTAKAVTPPSSPTLLASIIHTHNGKLKKDKSSRPLPVNDEQTTSDILTPANAPSIVATTAAADIKIVHVSSLKDDGEAIVVAADPVCDDQAATVIKRNEIVVNKQPPPTNKSLDEIVISDEES